ncbi:MAG: hypothetical protein WA913_04205 [Pricia sp.]
MRTIYYLLTINLIFTVGCEKYSSDTIDGENTLTGKWQLTEAFISAGGPQYWVDVEEGETIEFLANGSFVSNRFTECSNGNFSVESTELLLDYDCDGFEVLPENEDGSITYNLELDSDYFIVTPTSGPICIEGCSYKYSRKQQE